MIKEHTEKRLFGFIEGPMVNVLDLNIDLK
jgi:K+-transporting ATPase c subunit